MTPAECEVCSRPSIDDVPYCPKCADAFRAELLAVPGLVVDLDITSDRLDRLSKHQEGGKSTETPLPIKLGKEGFPVNYRRPLAALSAVVYSHARYVRKSSGIPEPDLDAPGLRQLVLNQRSGRSHRYDPAELLTHPIRPVELLAVWLAHQPVAIRKAPRIGVAHLEFADMVARIRKLVDRLPERVYKGPCPYIGYDAHGDRSPCGTRLYVERGEEWIRCPKCGSMHDVRQLEASALHSAEDRLFELSQIRRLLDVLGEPVPKSTLYAWANDPQRKRLEPKAWRRFETGQIVDVWIDRRDTPLYRLGDVRELRRRYIASGGDETRL